MIDAGIFREFRKLSRKGDWADSEFASLSARGNVVLQKLRQFEKKMKTVLR